MQTIRRPARPTERRRSRRYLPPRDFRIALKRPGLLGFLGGDLLKACLNVSEGGLRAVLAREVEPGRLLRARVEPGGGDAPFELALRVQYAVPSGTHPGAWEAGLRFETPAPAALRQALLRRAVPLNRTTRRVRRDDAWGAGR